MKTFRKYPWLIPILLILCLLLFWFNSQTAPKEKTQSQKTQTVSVESETIIEEAAEQGSKDSEGNQEKDYENAIGLGTGLIETYYPIDPKNSIKEEAFRAFTDPETAKILYDNRESVGDVKREIKEIQPTITNSDPLSITYYVKGIETREQEGQADQKDVNLRFDLTFSEGQNQVLSFNEQVVSEE
ncbi:hypothetical protein [Hutsoniella sourekii]|uniref:hypothetical protein n=1 Tax=Hutsoniella sourekii TaxID=87650 RepID=UPI0004864B22|nr:hypothetical protein [Hutsoniella sourekii]